MIHPTRTNLLLLKDKSRSVVNSVAILKARHQGLIREFLATSGSFLRSREEIKAAYGRAMDEMRLSLGDEGRELMESLAAVNRQGITVEIAEQSVMGLRYRDVTVSESAVRPPDRRGYDYRLTTPHLEESIHLYETVLDDMLELAAFESRLKRLGDEIVRISRRIRVLEERTLPELSRSVRGITQYIGERERESYYRLKQFKKTVTGQGHGCR